MLWAGADHVDAYVGTKLVAICKPREQLVVWSADASCGASELIHRWGQDQQRPLKIRIWLSGGLCRPFLLPPIARSSADELRKIAASLIPAQIGWSEPALVRVDMPSVRGDSTVGVAVKNRTIEELTRALGAGRHRPVSIQPWWGRVLRAALAIRPDADCLVVQDCDSVCLIAGERRSIRTASVVTPIADHTAAEAAIARLRFSQEITSKPMYARLALGVSESADGDSARPFGSLVEWIE